MWRTDNHLNFYSNQAHSSCPSVIFSSTGQRSRSLFICGAIILWRARLAASPDGFLASCMFLRMSVLYLCVVRVSVFVPRLSLLSHRYYWSNRLRSCSTQTFRFCRVFIDYPCKITQYLLPWRQLKYCLTLCENSCWLSGAICFVHTRNVDVTRIVCEYYYYND